MKRLPEVFSAAFACLTPDDSGEHVYSETIGSLAHCVGFFQFHLGCNRPSVAVGDIRHADTGATFYEFELTPTQWSPRPRLSEVIHAPSQDMFRQPSLLREHAAALTGLSMGAMQ